MRRRNAMVWPALALFLLGTNYCFLGLGLASTGAHMPACHATAARMAASEECCHTQTKGETAPTPETAKQIFPCCILLASPSSVSLDAGMEIQPSCELQAVVAPALVQPTVAGWQGHPPDRATSPPSEPPLPPLGSRAPPLA